MSAEGYHPTPIDQELEGKDTKLVENEVRPYYESQFQEPYPLWLQRCLCGVTSLETTLKSMGFFREQSHGQFVADYASDYAFNIPAVGVEVDLPDTKVILPVCFDPKLTYQEVEQQAKDYLMQLDAPVDQLHFSRLGPSETDEPHRTFTIEYGFDHRFIGQYLDKKGLEVKSEIFRGSLDELSARFQDLDGQGLKPHALVSVAHSLIQADDLAASREKTYQPVESSHVIALHGIVGDKAIITDSAMADARQGLMVLSLNQLNDVYNGWASLVYERPAEDMSQAA